MTAAADDGKSDLVGIEIDPQNNLIAATSNDTSAKLEIFNGNGNHVRTIDLPHNGKPTGICLDQQDLYIADLSNITNGAQGGKIEIFSLHY